MEWPVEDEIYNELAIEEDKIGRQSEHSSNTRNSISHFYGQKENEFYLRQNSKDNNFHNKGIN